MHFAGSSLAARFRARTAVLMLALVVAGRCLGAHMGPPAMNFIPDYFGQIRSVVAQKTWRHPHAKSIDPIGLRRPPRRIWRGGASRCNLLCLQCRCVAPMGLPAARLRRRRWFAVTMRLRRQRQLPASDARPAVAHQWASRSAVSRRWQAAVRPKGRSASPHRCACWDDSVEPRLRARCRCRPPPRPCDRHRQSQ